MNSISGRQLRTLLVGGVIGCALGAGAIILVARHALWSQFDEALEARAEFIASLVDYSDESEVECDDVAVRTREYAEEEQPDYFQVWLLGEGGSSTTLARSISLEERDAGLAMALPPDTEAAVFGMARMPDGREGRSVTIMRVVEEADDDLPEAERQRLLAQKDRIVVTIVAGRESAAAMLAAITGGVIVVEGALLLGIAGLSVLAVRRGLRPLRDASRDVGSIDAAGLSARLGTEGAPQEVEPLLSGVNALLERLEGSFERERVSRAMLAHELRNPVAALLSSAEVARKWADDPEHVAKQLGRVVEDARALQRIIDTLLRVARVQGGQQEPDWQRVDLTEIVAEAVEANASLGRARGMSVEVDAPGPAPVRSDPDLLRIVVSNIVGNAFEHAPRDGRIDLRVERENGIARVVCANSVPDGARVDTRAIWGAFRSGDNGVGEDGAGRVHVGLGLAATKTLCATIGADVRVVVERGAFIASVETALVA